MDYPGIPIYPYYLAPLGVLRNRPRPVLKAGAPANEEAQAPPGEGRRVILPTTGSATRRRPSTSAAAIAGTSKMAEFLRQLAATHSVSAAARRVGMSRNSAFRLRNRLMGEPFDIAWEAAFRHGYDNLVHSALDREIALLIARNMPDDRGGSGSAR